MRRILATAILTTLLLAGCATAPEPTTAEAAPECRRGEEAHLVVVARNPGMGYQGMFPSHEIVTRDGRHFTIHAREEEGRGVVQEGEISGGTLRDVREALKQAGALEGRGRIVITSATIVHPDEGRFEMLCDALAPFGSTEFRDGVPDCVDGGGARWTVSRAESTRTASVAQCVDSGIAPFERALEGYAMPMARTT